jgi:hypothetical protein
MPKNIRFLKQVTYSLPKIIRFMNQDIHTEPTNVRLKKQVTYRMPKMLDSRNMLHTECKIN